MLLPIHVETSRRKIPGAMLVLLGINLGVYAYAARQGYAAEQGWSGVISLPPSVLFHWALSPGQSGLTAYFTAPWLHLNLLHLLGNLLFLWVFGAAAEEHLGPSVTVAIYLAGGLAAGLAQTAAGLAGIIPPGVEYAGSSGAIIALIVAFALRRHRARVRFWLLFLEVSLPAWLTLLVFALWFGLLPALSSDPSGGSSYWGHLGGLLAGLGLALVFRLTDRGRLEYELEDALQRVDTGDLRGGLDALDHLRKTFPTDTRISTIMARCYARVWDRDAAAREYTRSIQLQLKEHHVRQAVETWTEAISSGATMSSRLALQLGDALTRNGQHATALDLLRWAAAGSDEPVARAAVERLRQIE